MHKDNKIGYGICCLCTGWNLALMLFVGCDWLNVAALGISVFGAFVNLVNFWDK